jgi:hypothetical protein
MHTPFLGHNPRTGTPTVKRFIAGVTSDVGVAIGGATESAVDANAGEESRVIRFLGHNTWIVVQGTGIYRTTNGGASYSLVLSDGDLSASVSKSGIFLGYPGGTATISFVTISGSSWYLWTSNDGTAWTKTGPFALGTISSLGIHSVTMWRGSFYGFQGRGIDGLVRTVVWNLGSLTVSSIAVPTQHTSAEGNLCVLDDRLFGYWKDRTTPSSNKLYELVSGTWVQRLDLTIGAGGETPGSKFSLFPDSATGHLIAISSNATGGWQARQINPITYAVVDITSTVTPPFGTGSSTSRIRWLRDIGVAGNPTFLFVSADAVDTTPVAVLLWNGVGSAPTSVGTGGAVALSYPYGSRNGGSYFWTPGQRHIERVSATSVLGGVRYGFKLFSPNPTVDAVSVRWLVGTATDESPTTPYGSLSSPSAGTLSAGNTQIDGLDSADNGATTFYVTWLAGTNGFGVGDFAKTTPESF